MASDRIKRDRLSRTSLNAASATNDALFEFESFKKKFLLANKHITKLNSTLSIRIEELNSQLSILYTENLRLRESQISLKAELRREREKTRKVVGELEGKAMIFTQHIGFLRKTLDIPEVADEPSPHIPQAIRPPFSRNDSSPPMFAQQRLSRVPDIPGIQEDDEPPPSPSHPPVSSVTRKKRHRRPSHDASASSGAEDQHEDKSPMPPVPLTMDFSSSSQLHRKPRRRESGLLIRNESLAIPRPSSPVPLSSSSRMGGLSQIATRIVSESERDENDNELGDKEEKKPKKKFADVTNTNSVPSSPTRPARKKEKEKEKPRKALAVVDNIQAVKDPNPPPPRPFLTPPRSSSPESIPVTKQPTKPKSKPATPEPEEDEQGEQEQDDDQSPKDDLAGGREKRVRKSVNYAEPKLNTKMRKPGPDPKTTKKRASAAAVLSTTTTTSSAPSSRGSQPDEPSTSAKSKTSLPRPIAKATTTAAPKTYILDESWDEDDAGDADIDGGDDEYIPPSLLRVPLSGNVNVERRRGYTKDETRRKTFGV